MISTGDLRKGVAIEWEGQPCNVVEWQHIKMGRGGAIVRMKLRNLITGSIVERTVDAGDKFPRADIERRIVTYQYTDGEHYHFMDTETFDQVALTEEQLGDTRYYLIDDMNLDLIYFKGNPISVEPPITVDLKITYTEPGFKGDTATGGNKPATVETGLTVQVPLFVNTGDTIRIKTDGGTYVERVG